VFTGLLIGPGIVAKARWDNSVVPGPLVPGTAKVIAARKRWLVTALHPTEETFEEPFLSEIELRIDVRGRESYNVTRSFWITGPPGRTHLPIPGHHLSASPALAGRRSGVLGHTGISPAGQPHQGLPADLLIVVVDPGQ